MGFKTFGKLVGNTPAAAVLAATAAGNTTTPYTTQIAGAKFMAWGEGASSNTFNRALGALQTNIEALAESLDAPALADTRIVGADVAGEAYGSAALHGLVAATEEVALDGDLTANGTAPITWIYTGLHQDQIHKFIRLYRYSGDTQAGQNSYDGPTPPNAYQTGEIFPDDIYDSTGTSLFAGQTYLTGLGDRAPHTVAAWIPPITPVITKLPPYGSTVTTDDVATWWKDGLALTNYTWAELYMRPGCFVHIAGAGANTGLYRISRVRNAGEPSTDKAVLSRGGLIKVGVTSTAGFTAGGLVGWNAVPNDSPASAQADRRLYAYIAYIDATDNALYLTTLGGEEDFAVTSKTNGQKVSYSGAHGSVYALGNAGEVDLEVNSDSSASLRVGTKLYDASNSATNINALSVTPAGYPIVFDDTVVGGTVTPCNPIGFSLASSIIFASTECYSGNYLIHCKTLSTVREKLATPGAAGQWKIIPDASAQVGINEFQEGLIRSFARYVKTGIETAAERGGGMKEAPSGPFSPTSLLLGDNLWEVDFVQSAGNSFSSTHTLGATINILTPAPTSQTTRATIVHMVGNRVVFGDVSTVNWNMASRVDTVNQLPIQVNSTNVVGPDTYTVSSINHAPYLRYFGDTSFVPEPGLNAAYNNQYASSKNARVPGAGRFIQMLSGLPLTIVLPTAGTGHIGYDIKSVNDSNQILVSITGATKNAQVNMTSGALGFKDSNTPATIPLSDGTHTGMPSGTASVLEALRFPWIYDAASDTVRLYGEGTASGTVSDATCLVFPAYGKNYDSGTECKIVYDPNDNVLKAGWVYSNAWNTSGQHSIAFGRGVGSLRDYSISFGDGASADNSGTTAYTGMVLVEPGAPDVEHPGYSQHGVMHCTAILPNVAGDFVELLPAEGDAFAVLDGAAYFIEVSIVGYMVARNRASVTNAKLQIQASADFTEVLPGNKTYGVCVAMAGAAVPGDAPIALTENTEYSPWWGLVGPTLHHQDLKLKWDLSYVGVGQPARLHLYVGWDAGALLPVQYVWSATLTYNKIRSWA